MSEVIESEPSLLDLLETALPIKRKIEIEGWPKPVWVWKLELSQLVELSARLQDEGQKGRTEWMIELLALCLGDEGAPGVFRSARGRSWLLRQGEVLAMLVEAACDFNNLSKPQLEASQVATGSAG